MENRARWFLGIIFFLITLLASISFILLKSDDNFEQKSVLTSKNDFWLEKNDILLYLETITQIKDLDLYLNPEIKRSELIRDTIKSYLEKIDPFAAYLNAEEFTKWKNSQGDQYVGIGMEILKQRNGQIICLPYKDSPAEKAGIRAGDRLIGIEEFSVSGHSILEIGSWARGLENTSVNLLIANRDGEQKKISVIRSHVLIDSLTVSRADTLNIIKISAFTQDTEVKLRKALADIDKNKPVVIDLRGNAGGDLSVAIDSTMLFLNNHKKIVSIKTRQNIEKYESGNEAINSSSPLFLWQDDVTASAAEVFIAALTNNGRAISIGKKSFGKGTKQDIFELSDGSALFITTGFLQSPDGVFFDGKGLNPDYALESANPQTAEYLLKVNELLTGSPLK